MSDPKNFLNDCLKELVAQNGTDLHVKAGALPRVRAKRRLAPIDVCIPTSELLIEQLNPLMNDHQKNLFHLSKSVDFAFSIKDLGRFRVNAFYQKGEVAIVIRYVKNRVPSFEELGLPPVLGKVAAEQRGLILVVGPVGSGKSTSIAALVDYMNHREDRRIISIEDPIEFIHTDDKAYISQREIGLDCDSFQQALRYVVRQDPDVIIIGEIRDAETFHASLAAAETGRLVISTVHGKNVLQGFERVLGFYSRDQHTSVLQELSYNMKAMISQRLLPKKDGSGLVPAYEILLNNASVGKVLREARLEKVNQVMQNGSQEGMQTLNQSLLALFQGDKITKEEALAASDHPHSLEMNMKGIFLDEAAGGILGG